MSFTEGTKEIQEWLQWQFSGQINSRDCDTTIDMDHAAAVAAASYAICCMEQTDDLNLQIRDVPEIAQTRHPRRSKTADSIQKPRNSSRKMLDNNVKPESSEPKLYFPWVEPDLPKPESSGSKAYLPWVEPDLPKPESSRQKPGSASFKKPDLPSDRPANPAFSSDLPKSQPHKPKPVSETFTAPALPPVFKPPPPPPRKTVTQRSKIPENDFNSLADTWERSELEKTKRRYEKLKDRITSWEDGKKTKARRKLEKTQGQPEHNRSRALQKFREDMEFIDEIAKGARVQAEARRKDEVIKVKGKANAMRATGKVPRTCWCF